MDLGDEPIEFKINHQYAKKYEVRKRNEELSKLKEKYEHPELDSEKDLVNDSSSEEEDEYGELITPEVDAQIMKTITAIRSKVPEVYNVQANFFADEEIEKARRQWQEKQKKRKSEAKPIHLKDYQRQILLKNDNNCDSDNDDDISTKKFNKKIELTQIEEEQKLKEEFKNMTSNIVTNDDDDDGYDDFFIQRLKTAEEIRAEEEDYQKFLLENMTVDDGNKDQIKMWKNFKENPNIDKDEAFLMEYILNRGWIDKDSIRTPTYEELVAEHNYTDEDEFDEAVDNFESQYNFRFEEEGSTKIISYSRNVEDSMRRVDNKRKIQRHDREGRKAEEKKKQLEELKRFKNLKKKEIYEKLQKIKEITGNENVGFEEVDLEEDFDPEKYDDKMQRVFDEKFYDKQADDEKPVWDDEIGINDIINRNKEKSASANKKSTNVGNNDDNFLMDADYLPGGEHYNETFFNKNKKKIAKEEKNKAKRKFDEYLDEYYQLNYEDIIDDIPVRFKYSQVKPTSFGLTPTEILLADEKDLNEFVSLKKYAPYRPDDVVEKDVKNYSKKKRLREFRKKIENYNNK